MSSAAIFTQDKSQALALSYVKASIYESWLRSKHGINANARMNGKGGAYISTNFNKSEVYLEDIQTISLPDTIFK